MTSEESKRLSYFSEQGCKSRCEKTGNCFDCIIEFEDVKAIEHLLKEHEELKNRIDMAIKYIESNPNVYIDENIICVDDIIDWENLCKDFKEENKTEFIRKLLQILEGRDEQQ